MPRRSKRLMQEFRPSPEPLDISLSAINRMFPLEVVSSFMCLCKPRQLYSLAFVCRSWQHEAERLLYGNLYLRWQQLEQMWSCLIALANYPQKAAFVRSLNMYHPYEIDPMLLKRICAVLPVLPNLEHLGLVLPRNPSLLRSVNAALKRCTFTLDTLSINISPLSLDWTKSHIESLRAVVIQECWRTLISQSLKNWERYFAQNNTHLFCLSRKLPAQTRVNVVPDMITVFPLFAPGLATWDPRIIRDLFCVSNNAKPTDIGVFRIYLEDLSDEKVVRSILEPIAKIFSHITMVYLLVQDAHISHFTAEISTTLSLFTMLNTLIVECVGSRLEISYQFTQEDCDRLAYAWEGANPKLCRFSLPNGVATFLNDKGKLRNTRQ